MSTLTDQTLKRITEGQIRPIPRFLVQFANLSYWVGSFALVVLSALATAISTHVILEIDWDAYVAAGFSLSQMIFSGVPLFTLILFAFFLWLSVYFLHATKRGYRYPLFILAGMFFLVSVLAGYFFEQSAFDRPVEQFLSAALPRLEKFPDLIPSVERQWDQPERGLLGGTIQSSAASGMEIKDIQEKNWYVDYSEAHISPAVTFEEGEAVKVIGKKRGDYDFKAAEVRVWKKESVSESSRENEHDEE